MSQRVRLAVAHDHEIVVVGIAAVLAPFADRIEVVELDSSLPVSSPADLVLYDSFGQQQGATVDLDRIVGRSGARLVIFSWNTQPELVAQSLEAGAAGYVSKRVSGADLVDALERIHQGEVVTPTAVTGTGRGHELGTYPGQACGLTSREAEILALICQGLSNAQVARRAYLSLNTVKTYIRSLYRKIQVSSRSQAVIWGVEHGFRPDRLYQTGSAAVQSDLPH